MGTLVPIDGGKAPAPAIAGKNHDEQREGAEVVNGSDACYRHSVDLLEELGFCRGVMPLKDLVECGRVRATGFVWMKLNAPYEHFFKGTGTRVCYGKEVTAYVEKGRMRKLTGVRSKQMMMWVPIVEMSVVNEGRRIYFKSSVGIGKSFPASAFEGEGDNE